MNNGLMIVELNGFFRDSIVKYVSLFYFFFFFFFLANFFGASGRRVRIWALWRAATACWRRDVRRRSSSGDFQTIDRDFIDSISQIDLEILRRAVYYPVRAVVVGIQRSALAVLSHPHKLGLVEIRGDVHRR